MLLDISTKTSSKDGFRFTYNKLPDTDSVTVLNRRSVDTIIETMFKLSGDVINTTGTLVKSKHVLIRNQII